MNYNYFVADDNFYFNLLNMKPELRDANFKLLGKTTAAGKRLRDDKLPFILESPTFLERIIDARHKLGLKNKKTIYSENSSAVINRLMRLPTRDELIRLGLVPYDAEQAAQAQELIGLLTESLKTEKDPEAIESIKRDIDDMAEAASGYLVSPDEDYRKYLLKNSVIEQILRDSSLDKSWYVIVENIILNGRHPDNAYVVNVPIGVTIEDVTPNGDVIIRIAKGCTKQEYLEAWKNVSRFTGEPIRQPKTDSKNKRRDLGIVRDMNAGIPTSQIASKYFPDKIQDTDLFSHIHKIYKRKSIK